MRNLGPLPQVTMRSQGVAVAGGLINEGYTIGDQDRCANAHKPMSSELMGSDADQRDRSITSFLVWKSYNLIVS